MRHLLLSRPTRPACPRLHRAATTLAMAWMASYSPAAFCDVETSWERLYDNEALERTASQVQSALRESLRDLVVPATRPEHRAAVQGIEVLVTRGAVGPYPMNAYANAATRKVSIPALTPRMFGDLLYAWAWLGANRYSPETVLAYLSMLKYQYAGRRQVDTDLSPFKVLGIPDNVRTDEKLAAQVNWQFNSAMFFLLCHEVGHVVLGHRVQADGLTPSASQAQEVAADAFALEVMRSIGQTPEGLSYYFAFASVFEPFAADGVARSAAHRTHPVSVQRILTMSNYIRANATAFARVQRDPHSGVQYFNDVATMVDTAVRGVLDGDYAQRRWRQLGLSATPTTLGPRPPESIAPPPTWAPEPTERQPATAPDQTSNPLVGRWIDDSSILHRSYLELRGDGSYTWRSRFQSVEPRSEIETLEEGQFSAKADRLTLTPTRKLYVRDGRQEPDVPREQVFNWAVAPMAAGRGLHLANQTVRLRYRSQQ